MNPVLAGLKTRVKLFIFDMDDTLADTERLTVSLIERYFSERAGVKLDESDREFVFGHGWRDIYTQLIGKYRLSLNPDEIQAAVTDMKRVHVEQNELPRATGLDRILAFPVRKALVSGSGTGEIRVVLDHLGIRNRFDPILSVDDFHHGKPDPAGFRMALELAGAMPEEAIVFEDSGSGLMSGRAADIFTVFVREFAWSDRAELADAAFDTLEAFSEAWAQA
jgi:HAD superfamily hydrolase (TIGR01509 family)